MRYLLDTNILSYLEERSSPFHIPVKKRLSSCLDTDEIFISILTLYELYYSLACTEGEQQIRIQKLIRSYLNRFQVLPLQADGAAIFGELKALLRKQTPHNAKALDRHNVDLIIASCAIQQQATLVSNDKLFMTISQSDNRLKFENWANACPSKAT